MTSICGPQHIFKRKLPPVCGVYLLLDKYGPVLHYGSPNIRVKKKKDSKKTLQEATEICSPHDLSFTSNNVLPMDLWRFTKCQENHRETK